MDYLGYIISLIFLLNLIAIFAIIFVEKKNPSSALAWIMVLLCFPIIGFLLYLFVGSSQKLKLTSKKYKMDNVEKEIRKEINKIHKFKSIEKEYLFKLNNNSFFNTSTNKNDIVLYNNMNEATSKMLKEMLNAKESINVNFFIFKSCSAFGEKVMDVLCKKAKEGIKVKLTYDRLGALNTKKSHFKTLKSLNGEVYAHLPSIVKTIFQVNYRTHRKMVIIDGDIAYTGGMNIGDEYLNLSDKIYPWRDTFARITGESVMFIQSRFLLDFIYLKKQALKRKYKLKDIKQDIKGMFKYSEVNNDMKVQLVYNGPDTVNSHIKDGYTKMICEAKKTLYIATPYFIPDEAMLEALRLSIKSGVDVRLIVPGIPDKKFVYYVTLSFVEKLVEYGAKVYIHKGFIHSKLIICDDKYFSFGTCNLDVRSFKLNYENNLFVKSSTLVRRAKSDYNKDIKNSKKLTSKDIKEMSKIKKFLGLIYRLLSPVL